jgi:hypothetical protein
MLIQQYENSEQGEPKEEHPVGVTCKNQTSFGMVCHGLTMFTTGSSTSTGASPTLTDIINVGNFSSDVSRVLSTISIVSSLMVDRKSLYQDLSPSPKHGNQRS